VKTYVLKRILLMFPTILGITLLTYAIVRLAPGDPIEGMIRSQAGNLDPKVMRADAERMRERLGLTEYHYLRDYVYGPESKEAPSPGGLRRGAVNFADKLVSIGIGYCHWAGRMCVGDFGESIKYKTSNASKNPLHLIAERIPVTMTLNILAQILIFTIAIPIGLASARHQGKWFDRISSFVLVGFWSIPGILAGSLLIQFLGQGGLGVSWFPLSGLHTFDYEKLPWFDQIKDLLWHATLPVVCLVYGGLAYLSKMGRASLLENLRADYVRTARAKGLPEERVIYHHALRNSLLPMITTLVGVVPGLIGGSVIIETIFSIPGTGLLLVGASQSYDLALIMTETLLYGVLTLVFLLIGDLLYAWADPRVRYE